MVLNVPAEDLRRYLGDFHLQYTPRRHRALLIDRHAQTTALIVPFGSGHGRFGEDPA